MKRWLKTSILILLLATVSITIFYAAAYAPYYAKVDYSTGNNIRVLRLSPGETPKTYLTIENDRWIEEAVSKTGNLTFTISELEDPETAHEILCHRTAAWNWTWIPDWVMLENGTWVWRSEPSEYQEKGYSDYILWVPDGNYYFVHVRFADGIPEFAKQLPSPTQTAGLVAAPWLVLLVAVGIQRRKR